MATADLYINGFYKKCLKVTGRHPPWSYLVGSKVDVSAKIFYADANARYPYLTAGLAYLVFWYQQRLGATSLPPIIYAQSDPLPLKSADFGQYLFIVHQP